MQRPVWSLDLVKFSSIEDISGPQSRDDETSKRLESVFYQQVGGQTMIYFFAPLTTKKKKIETLVDCLMDLQLVFPILFSLAHLCD